MNCKGTFAVSACASWFCMPAAAQPIDVAIRNFTFQPQIAVVAQFSTIRWTNFDGSAHTATSETGAGTLVPDGLFDSGLLFEGETFQFTFANPGIIYYFCEPHGMQGEVHVLPAPPCPADVNQDRVVDIQDLALLLAAFGSSSGESAFNPAADLSADGVIDLSDLALLLAAFGSSCP